MITIDIPDKNIICSHELFDGSGGEFGDLQHYGLHLTDKEQQGRKGQKCYNGSQEESNFNRRLLVDVPYNGSSLYSSMLMFGFSPWETMDMIDSGMLKKVNPHLKSLSLVHPGDCIYVPVDTIGEFMLDPKEIAHRINTVGVNDFPVRIEFQGKHYWYYPGVPSIVDGFIEGEPINRIGPDVSVIRSPGLVIRTDSDGRVTIGASITEDYVGFNDSVVGAPPKDGNWTRFMLPTTLHPHDSYLPLEIISEGGKPVELYIMSITDRNGDEYYAFILPITVSDGLTAISYEAYLYYDKTEKGIRLIGWNITGLSTGKIEPVKNVSHKLQQIGKKKREGAIEVARNTSFRGYGGKLWKRRSY